jgi:hypothetical protein
MYCHTIDLHFVRSATDAQRSKQLLLLHRAARAKGLIRRWNASTQLQLNFMHHAQRANDS